MCHYSARTNSTGLKGSKQTAILVEEGEVGADMGDIPWKQALGGISNRFFVYDLRSCSHHLELTDMCMLL